MAQVAKDSAWDIDIVHIAQEAQLQLHRVGRRSVQYKTDCPFCGEHRQNLELNVEKNVFHCWVCGAGGGLIRFYALLHNVSEHTAKETLYPLRSGKPRFDHPALHLSTEQVMRIGFTPLPRTKPATLTHRQWLAYRKRMLDWMWLEWKRYEAWKKRFNHKVLKQLESVTTQKA
ncbi:CHC2 zinc finger domain-containing protein [Alicyclobacillus tolerans]|uniref:CHC2 zinc finger domain-containing protein n=1 Tax=Alicyclobacillus tolerans TaxID=90970 RepID=UPI001F029B21|nr:CHC2 zinc finger domain-containing protein [Alicyclobacillus tolerans]MCF8568014.1 CHC2 zinc finger domain-containing protein [Alicyclobacillus tolerans]